MRHKIDKNKNPKAFLISIAVRLHQNNRRKFVWRQKIAPTEALNENIRCTIKHGCSVTPEDIALSNELRIALRNAADCLKDSLKLPLYMYYTAEMSIEEIASALKIPQGTVKSRLHKARTMLKNNLEVSPFE